MRWLRRWWAKFTHEHDWVVIHRGTMTVGKKYSGRKWSENYILERCTCSQERARVYRKYRQVWEELDMDWVNDQLARNGEEIPARHQE